MTPDPTSPPVMPDPQPPGPVTPPSVYVLVRLVGAGFEWVDGFAYQTEAGAQAAAAGVEGGCEVVALPLKP